LLCLLSFLTTNASSITIEGYAFLQNQPTHDNIAILFESLAPNFSISLTFTNAAGYFVIDINPGTYNITYTKEDFKPESINNYIVSSKTTLDNITLKRRSTIIYVPSDFSTIQRAINAAYESDTIIVERNTYKENINFKGKDIVVASRFLFSKDDADISNTIIDGNYLGHVVEFSNYETSKTQLIGFKIINGRTREIAGQPYSVCGGGIFCFNSSPTLKNLIVSQNYTLSSTDYDCNGAGIYLGNSNATLSELLVENNTTNYSGGGIGIDDYSNPIITNSTIAFNHASNGAGINCKHTVKVRLNNLIIENNTAVNSGGGIFSFANTLLIENSILTNNISNSDGGAIQFGSGDITARNISIINNYSNTSGSGICLNGVNKILISNCIFNNNNGSSDIYLLSGDDKSITIANSDFFNKIPNYFDRLVNSYLGSITIKNANGIPCDIYKNIFVDPLTNADYTLQPNSPCIDAGTNDGITSPIDLAGNQRILDGDGDNISIIDMGAYEYNSQDPQQAKYSITGNVYAGTDKLSAGIALLFYKTDTFSLPVKFSYITDGAYNFNVSDSGNYLLYIMPDYSNAGQYMPTYYVSESPWENAHVLNVDGKLYGVDLQMLPLSKSVIGAGRISGYIGFTDSSVYESKIYNRINNPGIYKNSPSDKNISNPAQNIGISIFNEAGDPIAWTLSNTEGYFEFNGLPSAKYIVIPQKSGYVVKNNTPIELTDKTDTIDNVLFQIEKGFISLNIKDNLNTEVAFINIYPNPVITDLFLELNPGNSGKVNIRLYDCRGSLVYNSDQVVVPSSVQTISISVNDLISGIYYGRLTSDNTIKAFKFVKTVDLYPAHKKK